MRCAAILGLCLALAGCRPVASLEEARRLLGEGQLDAACRAAEAAVERGGRTRALLALRIWIDCETRRGEGRRVTRALASRPEEDPLRLYGEALLAVAADAAALPAALAKLARAASRWPDEAELPYRAAVLLLADEDAARALPLLARACRLADTAACAVARAHALLDLGRAAEAHAEVRRLPRLSPRPEDLAQGRALIRRLGRRAEVVPEGVVARVERARALLESRERPAESLRLCEELLAEHPRLAILHTLAGLSQLRLGNLAEATVALRRAAELNPGEARNPLFLAIVHETAGRTEESVSAYRRALELDPFLGQAALRLAELQVRLGQLDEARRLLAHARAVQPALAETVARRLAALPAPRRER